MFDRKMFAQMRRAGLGTNVSKAKLSQAMVEILLQLPPGTPNLKDVVVHHLGLLGQMSATRDINEAWNKAKKQATNTAPDKFLLGSRDTLLWNDGAAVVVLDKKISSANFKKLNQLAEAEGCNVDDLVSMMIKRQTMINRHTKSVQTA